jgi:hypothetical protein
MFKRALLFLPLAVAVSLGGYALREMVTFPVAVAGVGSGISGGGSSGASAFTGNIGVATGTRLTLTQGVSAVTGLFSGKVTLSGSDSGGVLRVNSSGGNAIWAVANGADEGIYAESGNNSVSQACQCAGISAGNGVYGSSTGTGTAIFATNVNGGLALSVNGDTTSPAKAPLFISPQDAEPTGAHLVGHMYVTSAGVLKICTVAGTPGTWVSVGAQ